MTAKSDYKELLEMVKDLKKQVADLSAKILSPAPIIVYPHYPPPYPYYVAPYRYPYYVQYPDHYTWTTAGTLQGNNGNSMATASFQGATSYTCTNDAPQVTFCSINTNIKPKNPTEEGPDACGLGARV